MTRPTVLVSGCFGGIGQALVAAFRQRGYRVVGTDRAGAPGADAQPDSFVLLDLAALGNGAADAGALLDALAAACAGGGLSALVNNAAVQRLGAFDALTDEDFLVSMQVNVLAPAALARLCLPLLRSAGGSVINIGSIHAALTKPHFSAYAASKAALRGLTQAMAVELGQHVRCNVIEPAAVSTPMLEAGFADAPERREALAAHHPAGRIGCAAEVARLAVFLASDEAAFINGAVLGIDGGIRARLHDPG
ncbi:MAG: SDR family NAD(P)-dependent oxidoreductase [Gammaproteobacteria bacterium]